MSQAIEITDCRGEGNIVVKILESPRPFRAAYQDQRGLIHLLPCRHNEWEEKYWTSIKLHVPGIQFLGAMEERGQDRAVEHLTTVLPFDLSRRGV